MTMDKGRFDEIMAVIHANLVDDFKGLAAVPYFDVVPENDVSDYCGTAGSLLAGANVAWSEMEEFADEFTARFKTGDTSPAIAKIQAETNAKIQEVIDDVLGRGEKYGFVPTDETAKDLISDSVSLLNIRLTGEETQRAVEMLVEKAKASEGFCPRL